MTLGLFEIEGRWLDGGATTPLGIGILVSPASWGREGYLQGV